MARTITQFWGEGISNWLECTCGNRGEGLLLGQGADDTRTHDSWQYNGDVHFSVHTYKILRCQACEKVTIIRYILNGEMSDLRDIEPSDTVSYIVEKIFEPPRERHHAVPHQIADVLVQAQQVNISSPRACFILCRAALEEICRDKGIPDTKTSEKGRVTFIKLHDKLTMLADQENLPDALKDIVSGVKDIGNEGTHGAHWPFTRRVSREDAEAFLALVDYVVERIYIDPERAEEAARQLESLRKKVLQSNSTQEK